MRQLIIAYLNNQCEPAEADQVLNYLQTPEGQRVLEKIMEEEASGLKLTVKHEPNYKHILSDIHLVIEQSTQKKPRIIPLYRRWHSVAAAASFVLAVAAWWMLGQPADMELHETAYGETSVIELYDGSTVTLNANSTLKVATLSDKREVWLEGEAFFEVEEVTYEDEKVKFVVHTREVDVVVVGTTFNVQNRNDKTQVLLNSGKVWLENSIDKLEMEPGELAETNRQGRILKKEVPNADTYLAWKENKLVCRNTSLQEITEVIYHRFGYTTKFADDSLKALSVTGTLPLYQITLLTEALQESLDISIQPEGQTLLLKSAD